MTRTLRHLSALAMTLSIALGAAAAAAPARGNRRGRAADRDDDQQLPANAVVSNLGSPTGRQAYLLLNRSADVTEATIRPIAQRVAAAIGAQSFTREGGDVVVVLLQHDSKRIIVHRLGPALRISLAEPLPLPEALRKTVGAISTTAGRPEGDYDKELLLRAPALAADPENKIPGLTSLAQGGAARGLLQRFATGDDLGAALFGQRHAAWLLGHPDARQLRMVIDAAERGVEAPLAELPPSPFLKETEDADEQPADPDSQPEAGDEPAKTTGAAPHEAALRRPAALPHQRAAGKEAHP